jgi:hypothetical protein
MSERRTKPTIGMVARVLIYRKGMPCSEVMRQIPVDERGIGRGQFFLNGDTVHFAEEDSAEKKFIVYESITQVQRTTRGKKEVRLRP